MSLPEGPNTLFNTCAESTIRSPERGCHEELLLALLDAPAVVVAAFGRELKNALILQLSGFQE